MVRFVEREQLTNCFEALLKITEANRDHNDVDEAEVGDDGNHVDVDLLVSFQVLYIDTAHVLGCRAERGVAAASRTC
jgi:hypothetical protein